MVSGVRIHKSASTSRPEHKSAGAQAGRCTGRSRSTSRQEHKSEHEHKSEQELKSEQEHKSERWQEYKLERGQARRQEQGGWRSWAKCLVLVGGFLMGGGGWRGYGKGGSWP